MGILDRFERGLERVVNGAFAKTFASGLQPLEVAAALRRELDTRSVVVGRDRTLAPHRLTVRLSTSDFDRFATHGEALLDEMRQLVRQHAVAQRYSFAGPVDVRFDADARLSVGVFEIDSDAVRGNVNFVAVLEFNGKRVPLARGRTVLGRGSEADVALGDTGASRRHTEIIWDGERAGISDLGSTNGTRVGGERLSPSPRVTIPLEPDSVIDIGRTRIVFRVVPEDASPPATDHSRAARGRP